MAMFKCNECLNYQTVNCPLPEKDKPIIQNSYVFFCRKAKPKKANETMGWHKVMNGGRNDSHD